MGHQSSYTEEREEEEKREGKAEASTDQFL